MKDRDKLLPQVHAPKCAQHSGLDHAEAWNLELILGISSGWQDPKHLTHHLLHPGFTAAECWLTSTVDARTQALW